MIRRNKPRSSWSRGFRDPTPEQKAHIARLLDEANALGAICDPQIRNLLKNLIRNPVDAKLVQLLEDGLQSYRAQNVTLPDPVRPYPGPDSGLDQGEIEVGVIHETGLVWRIVVDDIGHVLLVGATGAGKTSVLYILLDGMEGRIPYLLTTFKSDIGVRLANFPYVGQAFRIRELKINLFCPPPGVPPAEWQQRVVTLFCDIWGLQYSRVLLHEICDDLRSAYEKYSMRNKKTIWFTPRDVLAKLQYSRSKYADGPKATLDNLCRVTGNVFEWGQGYPLDTLLLSSSTVLSFAGLADEQVVRFILAWLMEWIHAYLVHNGPNNGSPQFVFAMDDAQPLFSQANEKSEIAPLSQLLLIVRQAGLRFMAAAHLPNELAPAIFSQSSLIISVGGIVHQKEAQTVAAALGLHPSNLDRVMTPQKAEFVARENMGRYNRPFGGMVRQVPDSLVYLSESDRILLMEPVLNCLPFESPVPAAQVEQALKGVGIAAAPIASGPSQNMMRLAQDLLLNPWDVLNTRYRRLGIGGRVAQAAKDELVALGWAKEHAIPQQGNAWVLLEPLPAAYTALNMSMPSWGKGGYLHVFIQQRIASVLKASGHTQVRIEAFYKGKAVDVVGCTAQGEIVGFEVSLHLLNVVNNLFMDFVSQPRFQRLTAVCLSSADVNQAKLMIRTAISLQPYLPRIGVDPVATWM